MRDRTLAVGVIVIALATFGVATGSFTTVDATRDVRVATGSGYVGVDTPDGGVENGTDVTLFDLSNRFGTALDTVSVQVVAGGDAVSNLSVPPRLDPGETSPVVGDAACADGDTIVEFRISVAGDGVSVETTRSVTVRCAS